MRRRLTEAKDTIGYDLAALKLIGRVVAEQKMAIRAENDASGQDIWAGMGLGSDVAAALEGRSKRRWYVVPMNTPDGGHALMDRFTCPRLYADNLTHF